MKRGGRVMEFEQIYNTYLWEHGTLGVVVGGEADKNVRPLNYDWVMQIRQQCIPHNVHFEFRQCGTHFSRTEKATRYLLVTYAVKQEKQI